MNEIGVAIAALRAQASQARAARASGSGVATPSAMARGQSCPCRERNSPAAKSGPRAALGSARYIARGRARAGGATIGADGPSARPEGSPQR